MMMMIPEPWSQPRVDDASRSAPSTSTTRCLMEPWDGPAVDRLHRRHADRRGARPQRPAPVALLRHQGRPGRHGVRGRRARHRRRSMCCTRAACSPAACSWSTPSRAASSPTRRSSAQIASEQPYGEWLKREPGQLDDLPEPPEVPEPDHETRAAAPAGLRLHLRGPKRHPRRRWPATASRPSARWATTRRSRCCRTGRSCSTTTSSSCSRRSPTRRSTASAKRSSCRSRRRSGPRATCSSRSPRLARQSSCKRPILTNEELAKLRHLDGNGRCPASGRHAARSCSR